jgi:hypothetical protein
MECQDSVRDVANQHPSWNDSERSHWGVEVEQAGADCCYSGAGQFVPQMVACYDAGPGFPEFIGVVIVLCEVLQQLGNALPPVQVCFF